MHARLLTLLVALLIAGCQGIIGNLPAGDALSPGASTELDCSGGASAATSQLRRLTPVQYQNAVRDIFDGQIAPSTNFPALVGTSVTGFSPELGYAAVSEQDVEQIMDAADDVAVSIADNIAALLPCSGDDAPGDDCAQSFLDAYGQRTYRRPLSDAERDELMQALHVGSDSGASFAESIGFLVDAMLQHPQFIYVVEEAAPTPRALDGYELASRLSFMFLDTIPDDALMSVAADGTLTSPDVLQAQAERLLGMSNADATLTRFFREWTGTQRLSPADKPTSAYPFFDTAFSESLNDAFDKFTVGVVRSGGNLYELLRSSVVPVDANMAQFFGVAAPADGWGDAQLDATRYSGMVTQPAMMGSLAHTTTSSYVFRGRFIREGLLCQPIAPPPPGAQTAFSQIALPANPTGRDTSLAVRNNGTCGTCHDFIDPSGLAFEHFDGLGQFRATYDSGKTIDESDQLTGVDDATLTFTDHIDLLEQLANSPTTEACFATQVFRFAMSRSETDQDACAVDEVRQAFAADGDQLDTALLAFVTTKAFRFKVDP